MTMVLPFLVLLLTSLVRADQGRLIASSEYDEGKLGNAPSEKYKTSRYSSPRINYYQNVDDNRLGASCDNDGLYTMLSTRGYEVANPGPTILDSKGALIWTNDKYREPYNVAVQEYKGQSYLTFWAGDDSIRGHGAGVYYMLDSSYNESYVVRAANGLGGDLHEFKLTDQGTALMTIYNLQEADMTGVGGPKEGWIWEAMIQEVDIETGKALFEWRASQHIPLTESFRELQGLEYDERGIEKGNAWDWFHINSIDKDPKGNYIISSRHLHTIHYIDGKSGEVIWVLGGKSNMFEDLSNGEATGFCWQHHVRWQDDYTAITIFDNHSEGPDAAEGVSRGLYIELDTSSLQHLTAKVKRTFRPGQDEITLSQGSMQLLPSGNVILGYGFWPQYIEFGPNGDLLCDVHYAPASRFGTAGVQSYRIGKFSWTGQPTTSPDIAVSDEGDDISTVFVSWMGATEVARWRIEDAVVDNAADDQYSPHVLVDRQGFETYTTFYALFGPRRRYVRAVALDKDNKVLGTSKAVQVMAKRLNLDLLMRRSRLRAFVVVFTIAAVILISASTTIVAVRRYIRYRDYQRQAQVDPEEKMQRSYSDVINDSPTDEDSASSSLLGALPSIFKKGNGKVRGQRKTSEGDKRHHRRAHSSGFKLY